jgi:hypothetical protein
MPSASSLSSRAAAAHRRPRIGRVDLIDQCFDHYKTDTMLIYL